MRRMEKIIQYLDAGPALLHEIRDHIGGSVREEDIVATLRLGIRRGDIARTERDGQVAYKLAVEIPSPAAPAAPAVGGQGNNTDSDGREPSSFGLGDVAAQEPPAPADIAGSGTPDAGAGESVRTTHVLKVIDEIRAALPGGDFLKIDDLARAVMDLRAAMEMQATEMRRAYAEREALQEQLDAAQADPGVDVTDAAQGYLVRAPKRRLRVCKRGELAVHLAKTAAKNGSGYADVFALVPMGRAVRGAKWRDA